MIRGVADESVVSHAGSVLASTKVVVIDAMSNRARQWLEHLFASLYIRVPKAAAHEFIKQLPYHSVHPVDQSPVYREPTTREERHNNKSIPPAMQKHMHNQTQPEASNKPHRL